MSTWLQLFTAYPGVWSENSYSRFRPQNYPKSKPSEFGNFWNHLSEEKKKAFTPCKGDKRWARFVNAEKVVCIDPKHFAAGNCYNDDSTSLIYLKFAMSTLARPLYLVVKTIYHITVGWIKAIVDGVRHKEPAKKIAERVIRQLADIVRTPIYVVAITVVGIAGLIAAPFKMTLMYDIRAVIGRLSHEMFWGARKRVLDMNTCMRRELNIVDWTKQRQLQFKRVDESYNQLLDPELVAQGKARLEKEQEFAQYETRIEEIQNVYRKVMANYQKEKVEKPKLEGHLVSVLTNDISWDKPWLPLDNEDKLQSDKQFEFQLLSALGKELPKDVRAYALATCVEAEGG